jgi:hypothetical protein
LNIGQVLSNKCILVLCSDGVEIVAIGSVLSLENEGERVESFGLLRGLLIPMPLLDFLFSIGVKDIGVLLHFTLISYLPEFLNGEFFIVSPRLNHFGHQQWNNYNGN